MRQILPPTPISSPIQSVFRRPLADLLFLRSRFQFLAVRFEKNNVDRGRRKIVVARFFLVTVEVRNFLAFIDHDPAAVLEGTAFLKNGELFGWGPMNSFRSSAGFPAGGKILFNLGQNAGKTRVQNWMKKERI